MATPTLIHDSTELALDLGWEKTSSYKVRLGAPEKDVDKQRFPGVQGSFAADYGVSGRAIIVAGAVRLAYADWATLEYLRDDLLAAGGTWTFTSSTGKEYRDCLLRTFELDDPNRVHGDPDVDWRADYRIVLDQLEP